MPIVQSRRRFLTNAALAGAAGLGGIGAFGIGYGRPLLAAEPPPETASIRLASDPIICLSAKLIAELLRTEGFANIALDEGTEADDRPGGLGDMFARGAADIARGFAPDLIIGIDAGAPITILGGLHLGCFELLGNERVRGISGLKHKSVGVGYGSGDQPLLLIMLRLLGLDPATDINWVRSPSPNVSSVQLFADGKVDAFLGVPPDLQELRARNIGHPIVSSITDRPWSQYSCCLLACRTEFVREYPVATKHAARAFLKAVDLCASEPKRVAQMIAADGPQAQHDYALQALSEIRYDVWRDFDPEDAIRFYALRLHEAGLIKISPQKVIAKHTDWRFLNELKRELKA